MRPTVPEDRQTLLPRRRRPRSRPPRPRPGQMPLVPRARMRRVLRPPLPRPPSLRQPRPALRARILRTRPRPVLQQTERRPTEQRPTVRWARPAAEHLQPSAAPADARSRRWAARWAARRLTLSQRFDARVAPVVLRQRRSSVRQAGWASSVAERRRHAPSTRGCPTSAAEAARAGRGTTPLALGRTRRLTRLLPPLKPNPNPASSVYGAHPPAGEESSPPQ